MYGNTVDSQPAFIAAGHLLHAASLVISTDKSATSIGSLLNNY